MKILLVSINASYMHTSLAIRDLKNYADLYFQKQLQAGKIAAESVPEIELAEYTINQPVGEVLRNIGFTGSKMVLFSTYIWNAEYVCKILPDIPKILPGCITGAGGPEFGYGAAKYLKAQPALDFIIFGEGELTFTDLLERTVANDDVCTNITGKIRYSEIKGIYYRDCNGSIKYSGNRELIQKLDDIPFPYPELTGGSGSSFDPDHKIYYFESTRGCPFGCSYCLSSVDKSVRFKSLERACKEIQIFLDANVKLVKFVDRTYNLNPDHYLQLWKYILAHHNHKTMFHFEIEAEYLSDEALDFLQQIPEGVMQFEMGVQTSNKKTLKAINRSQNVEILAEKIRRIPRTIHQHLDLIAGLPYEDLESFGRSYDFVMALKPDALQLGFLKILGGTIMEDYAKKNGWKWMENPVYETFSTPYMSFADIAFLKDIEIVTDELWNKGLFAKTMNYVFRKVSPWNFMCAFTEFGRSKGTFLQARKDSYWFQLLNDFISAAEAESGSDGSGKLKNNQLDKSLLYDLLRYDFVRSGKKGGFPEWYRHFYSKENHTRLLEKNKLLHNCRLAFAQSEYEEFNFDVTSSEPEKHSGHFELLLRY